MDAQENDLSIMKNEISLLRREQTTQREQIASLTSSAKDASWAIASVKRSHDQMTGDVRALKRTQESYNDTIRVMRAEIANNSDAFLSGGKESRSVKQDLFQLRAQVTEDRERLDGLQRDVAQLRRTSGRAAATAQNDNRTFAFAFSFAFGFSFTFDSSVFAFYLSGRERSEQAVNKKSSSLKFELHFLVSLSILFS